MRQLAPLALALSALAAGCSDTEASERLRQNARATWDSAVEVAFETKEQALQELEARLQELEPRLEELKQRALEASEGARERLLARLEELELERLDLRERIEVLKTQGKEVWERVAREAQTELDGLKRRLDEALDAPR